MTTQPLAITITLKLARAARGVRIESPRKLKSILHAGLWVDIGSPETYLAANLDVLAGRLNAPLDPWTRGEAGEGGSWVGRDARVEGRMVRTVVGAGAVVPAGADLEDCVVWDGVVVPGGTHRRTVFYGRGGPAETLVVPG